MPPSKNSHERLTGIWRGRGPLALLLFPLGLLFSLLSAGRRLAYRLAWLPSEALPVPVVVIGNIIAGGAGKTPLTLWLAQQLRERGRRPGIVSRGYGRCTHEIRKVGAGSTAEEVGDEPLLLARRSGCPVFVGADRAATGRALLAANPECDLILCDDGLQHYRLQRAIEIAVLDRRGLMNGLPLPAGPLRELPSRLQSVDAVVLNGTAPALANTSPVFRMRLVGDLFYLLGNPAMVCGPADLVGKKLHAFAGIGEPQRFFDHLDVLGLRFEAHVFPDHHRYTGDDFSFAGDALLTTEKDALKCIGLTALPIWVLPVDAAVEPDLAGFILEKLDGCAPA